MLFYGAERRRLNERRADRIEDVSTGYGGWQSKQGRAAMKQTLTNLRRG